MRGVWAVLGRVDVRTPLVGAKPLLSNIFPALSRGLLCHISKPHFTVNNYNVRFAFYT